MVRRHFTPHPHDPVMSRAHALETFALFGREEWNYFVVRSHHRLSHPPAGLIPDRLQGVAGLIENRCDLRVLLRREAELATHVFTHPLADEAAMPADENVTRVACAGEESGGKPGEENGDERNREPDLKTLRHCQALASIKLSAMA